MYISIFKVSLEVPYIEPTQYLEENILRNKHGFQQTCLSRMNIREQCQKIQLKTRILKTKTMTVAITPTQRNSCRYMILDQNLGKNLKRYAKTLLSHLERTHKASYVKTNRKYYLTVIRECTSCTFHAMVNKLANQRKKSIDTLH